MRKKKNLDPYEEMMRGVISFSLIAFAVACFLMLYGCVSAPVAPNLKIPENLGCPKLNLPPVPQDVNLQIHGDKIEADAGGERVLRSYVACRAALR